MLHPNKIALTALLVSALTLQTTTALCTSRVPIVRKGVTVNSRRNAVCSMTSDSNDGPRSHPFGLSVFSSSSRQEFTWKGLASIFSVYALCLTSLLGPAHADLGASDPANAKITKGGASTLQSGRTISITRGVNLDRSDFQGLNLKGVAFQQSIVRDANFKGSNLIGASFFDATLDGSDFEGADMTLANIEMAQLDRVSLKVRNL